MGCLLRRDDQTPTDRTCGGIVLVVVLRRERVPMGGYLIFGTDLAPVDTGMRGRLAGMMQGIESLMVRLGEKLLVLVDSHERLPVSTEP